MEIRTDLDVPVFVIETETDLGPLLDYGPARQPDTSRFHAWEVAGTAHADAFIAGPAVGLLGCAGTVNTGPARYVVQAALAALDPLGQRRDPAAGGPSTRAVLDVAAGPGATPSATPWAGCGPPPSMPPSPP